MKKSTSIWRTIGYNWWALPTICPSNRASKCIALLPRNYVDMMGDPIKKSCFARCHLWHLLPIILCLVSIKRSTFLFLLALFLALAFRAHRRLIRRLVSTPNLKHTTGCWIWRTIVLRVPCFTLSSDQTKRGMVQCHLDAWHFAIKLSHRRVLLTTLQGPYEASVYCKTFRRQLVLFGCCFMVARYFTM